MAPEEPVCTEVGRRPLRPPYSPGEVETLLAAARALGTQLRRTQLLAVVVLGADPAVAGKLLCPLQNPPRRVRLGALPVLNVPASPLPGTVCTQRYVTFTMEELPLLQRHVYGSPEWKASYNRRGGNVERLFSTLKSATVSGLERGRIRVKGIVKSRLLVALSVAAANYWISSAFDQRKTRLLPGAAPADPVAEVCSPTSRSSSTSQHRAPSTSRPDVAVLES